MCDLGTLLKKLVDRANQTNSHLGQVVPTNLYDCTVAYELDSWFGLYFPKICQALVTCCSTKVC